MTFREKTAFAVHASIMMSRGDAAAYAAIKEACFWAEFTWQEYHVTLENGERILGGITFEHQGVIYWHNACDADKYYMQGINTKGGYDVYTYCHKMQVAVNEENEKRSAKRSAKTA